MAIALALAVFAFTGGSVGGLGLVAATLVCPITMVVVMWLLLGRGHHEAPSAPAPEAQETRP